MTVRRTLLLVVLLAFGLIVAVPPLLEAVGLGPDPGLLPPKGRIQALPDGGSIHFREFGAANAPAAATIVLVHGLPSFASDWRDMPQALAERSRRRVIAYDRTGYGYSSRNDASEADAYTQDSNADDLLALLDALHIERAALVGWSYGGAIVQTLAAARPERVSHAIFVGSVGPASTPEGLVGIEALLRVSWGRRALRWSTRVPPVARMVVRAPITAAFSRADAVPPGWLDYSAAMLGLPGTLLAYKTEVERYDPLSLEPERVGAPALVIHGTDDRLVRYAVAEDLDRRLPNSKLVPYFEGSHMLPVTHADRLAEEIARFLSP